MADKMTVEDRIKHFLRLAEDTGATQAERDTASAQAERLMTKNLIDRVSLDLHSDEKKPREEIVKLSIWFPGGGGSISYDLQMGMADVARAMQCYPVYVDYRTVGHSEHTTVYAGRTRYQKGILLQVIGFKSDAEAAVQLIQSLMVQAPIALKQYQKEQKAQGSWGVFNGDKAHDWRVSCGFIQSFGVGAGSRVRETRKSVLNEYDDKTALILVDRSKAVSEHVNETMKLRTKYDRRRTSSLAASAGFAAGRDAAGANRQGALRQNSRALGN